MTKFIYISFIFVSLFSLSQEKIQFSNYTISSGLSQSVSLCMVQDNFGTVWIGTQDGLNKFDGNQFKVFTSGKTKGLDNEYILSATKDQKGNLYFGTLNGLIKYNPITEQFKTFHVKQGKKAEIKSIHIDNTNKVWLGSTDGRLLFLNNKEQLEIAYDVYIGNTIVGILPTSNNKTLLIFSENGQVIKYNSSKGTLKQTRIPDVKQRRVNKIIHDNNKQYLLCTTNGILEYNFNKNDFSIFDTTLLSYNISDALFTNHGEFFCTKTRGLLVKNKEGNFISYRSDFFQKTTIADNSLNFIFKDKNNLIWLGSQRGLSTFNSTYDGIHSVTVSSQPDIGLVYQDVWSISGNDSINHLYIGNENGISLFNEDENKYYHFKKILSKNGDSKFTVHSILPQQGNKLYIGSVKGLFLLEYNLDDLSEYTYTSLVDINAPDGFNQIYTVLRYDTNRLLISTKGGVAVYNETEDSYTYLKHEPNDAETIGQGFCRLLFKSKNQKFYVAPSAGGLYEIKETDNIFVVERPIFYTKLKQKIDDYIASVYQPSDYEYWLGTMGGGIVYLNTKTNFINHYNTKKGIPNEVIYAIHSLDNENLYMSSNRGIIRFNIASEVFTSYWEEDGLTSNEFNLNASYKDEDNVLYFGGIQGYSYFDPEKLETFNPTLKVRFSEIWMENEEILPQPEGLIVTSISQTSKIELPYKHRTILLKFFTDNYINPKQVHYKYKLVGDDEFEEVLGSTNELRFTSLSPGEYTLYVYAQLGRKKWSKYPAKLQIFVTEPFWMAWWFRITVMAIFGLILFIFIRRRIERERRQQVILEMKIRARTNELELKTKKIEEQKKKIEEQKEKIEKQKKRVEKQKEQSDSILENVLPHEAVLDLKSKGKADARSFDKVSVMFTDFVGFTTISDNMEAQELVAVLDSYFRAFDEIIGEHELEKIKTIGDAYMCAGGVPIRNKTNPIDTVLAAIKIREFVIEKQKAAREKGEIEWSARIGINSGPVSAGIIGTKRFAYDVWGKTVNHAQRMERLCKPSRIAITGDTFEHIEPYFECSFAGIVESKSKGKIDMYYVDAIKSELSVDGKGLIANQDFKKLVSLHFFSSINYMKAEREIMTMLSQKLSPALHYHSIAHTKDVTRQAERIAIGEGITDNDLFLLKSAASYHDAGFVEQYEENESIGARMATEILPEFGYTQEDIKRIEELIFATTVPHQPKNKLEEIICDADLDYLGRDDFHEIADKLRLELREHNKINSDRAWDEMQVKFLNMHKYFTKTSIETRQAKKEQNLREIEQRLKENIYKD